MPIGITFVYWKGKVQILMMKIWDNILNLGISGTDGSEKELVRLYNAMSVLTGFGVLLMSFCALLFDYPISYTIITIFISLIYFSVLISNAYEKIVLARYIISIGSPIWICTSTLLIGGDFSQSIGILSSMAITYVAFQQNKSIRNKLLLFNFILFVLTVIYINNFGPIIGEVDFPYDELMVFWGGIGWTIVVLYLFDKDRTSLVNNLKTNNVELKSTTEELERFTYIASHDLKSPLRTIISFIGLIERSLKREDYDSVRENLKFVKTGAEQMNFLVQDILEFSKLKKYNEAAHQVVDLNQVFEKARYNLDVEIKEKSAQIFCQGLPPYLGNELEFIILFQNFIQNGIKYNESKTPSVQIYGKTTNDKFKLSFKDNGIGIEEAYYDQIFQFFKRLHNADQYQGTGLGLGVCKKIINKYEGEIEIESTLGSGTTFTLIFPLKEVNLNQEQPVGDLIS